MNLSEQIIERLKIKRGWTDEVLAQLKNPSIGDLHNPFLLENIEPLIQALYWAKTDNKPITIIPDYDADGILSGSLAVAALSVMEFEHVHLYEPRIQTGYGMTPKSVSEALKRYPDTQVILTTDNGSNAHSGVEYALEQGVEVLITDHHQADSGDPVKTVVNPNRPTDTYPNKGLSGTAVMWKVMQAYALTFGMERQQRLIDLLVVLVGMSVISDVMPLLDENRYFVEQSIQMLQNPTLLRQGAAVDGAYGDVFRGLFILHDICNEHGKFNYGFDESTLGFVFGPMLNSPRRMTGSSKLGFKVFLSDSEAEARESAVALFETNEKRKTLMRKYNQAYLSPVHTSTDKLAYMIGVVPYRPGLIGLVAGRFTSDLQLPSIVFGNMKLPRIHYHGDLPDHIDVVSGSGRSPEWFNLHGALTQMSEEHPEWFVSFGGHHQAAGVGIHARYYEAFRLRFTELVCERMLEVEKEQEDASIDADSTLWLGYKSANSVPAQPFDIELATRTDTQALVPVVDFIDELKPFGQGFSEPEFGVRFNTADTKVAFMGADKQHVKFTLPNGLVVIQWNGADPLRQQLGHVSGPFDFEVRGTLSVNEFRGNLTVQMIVNQLSVQ